MLSADLLKVVIVGAGKLGLGLLARRSISAGVKPVIAGRSHGDPNSVFDALSHSKYFHCGESQEELLRYDIADTIDVSETDEPLIDFISKNSNVVLMCAVGPDGQAAVASAVRAAVGRRESNKTPGQLVLLPCENEISIELDSLRALSSSSFVMVDVMVDQICQKKTVINGSVRIFAEKEFEWAGAVTDYLQVSHRHSDFINHMGIAWKSDLEAVRCRKKIMMNGVQLACALLGSSKGYIYLQDYINENPNCISELLDEMVVALDGSQMYDFNREELVALADWYEGRILRSANGGEDGDTVQRMTRKITPTEIDLFVVDLKGRLVLPYAWIARSKGIDVARKTQIGIALRLAFDAVRRIV